MLDKEKRSKSKKKQKHSTKVKVQKVIRKVCNVDTKVQFELLINLNHCFLKEGAH